MTWQKNLALWARGCVFDSSRFIRVASRLSKISGFVGLPCFRPFRDLIYLGYSIVTRKKNDGCDVLKRLPVA